jgi:two-component system cell cycle response regulator DivK
MSSPVQPLAPLVAPGSGALGAPGAAHRGTVLLVEDNPDNREIVDAMLSHAGYRVVMAHTGDEGVALARSAEPDVVLMDIALPVLDGWEATQRLKSDPATRHIPVIALTAHAMPEHRARAQAAGFDGYLTKPIEPREVLAEVERIARRR